MASTASVGPIAAMRPSCTARATSRNSVQLASLVTTVVCVNTSAGAAAAACVQRGASMRPQAEPAPNSRRRRLKQKGDGLRDVMSIRPPEQAVHFVSEGQQQTCHAQNGSAAIIPRQASVFDSEITE